MTQPICPDLTNEPFIGIIQCKCAGRRLLNRLSIKWRTCLLWPVLLLLSSCGTAGSGEIAEATTSPYSEWHLVQVTQGSLGLTLGDSRPPFTLVLAEDGRARGQIACNSWTGQARLNQDLLRLQRIQATQRACSIEDPRISALERRYLSALQTTSRYEVSTDGLTLTLSNGEVWQFIRN